MPTAKERVKANNHVVPMDDLGRLHIYSDAEHASLVSVCVTGHAISSRQWARLASIVVELWPDECRDCGISVAEKK
jgi:hypothetical protein